MKRAALGLAILSAAALSGCGARDAGRWLVDASLRSAYGCSLLVSSDQAAGGGGELAQRPEPLIVQDPSIVASRLPSPRRAVAKTERAAETEPAVEIAELPISRDLSSFRAAGTLSSRSAVRMAHLPRAAPLWIQVAAPEPLPPPLPFGVCPGTRG
jgi:hypothetical protein